MEQPSAHRLAVIHGWLSGRGPIDVLVLPPGGPDGGPVDPAADLSDGPADDGLVAVVLETIPGPDDLDQLVDLAVASGGRVHVSPAVEAGLGSRLEGLEVLTLGRVRASAPQRRPATTLRVARPPVGRRSLWRQTSPEPAVMHVADDPHGRLVESLRALGVAPQEGSAASDLAVDGCVVCGQCTRSCPHDALAFRVDSGVAVLEHRTDRCLGEQACVQACPFGALSLLGALSWNDVLERPSRQLASVEVVRCERCQVHIPSTMTHCGPCSKRLQEPFGVHISSAMRSQLSPEWIARLGLDKQEQ